MFLAKNPFHHHDSKNTTGQRKGKGEHGCKLRFGDRSQRSPTCLSRTESSRQVYEKDWKVTAGRTREGRIF